MSETYSQVGRGSELAGQDPLGLRVIYRPPGDRQVDIIFVHGLGGSSQKTWSWNRDIDYFWPLRYLPCEPDINQARILTFGYSANFRRGSAKNKMAILDFAKELLSGLKYGQDELAPEMEDLEMGQVSSSSPDCSGRTESRPATNYLRGALHGRAYCQRGMTVPEIKGNTNMPM